MEVDRLTEKIKNYIYADLEKEKEKIKLIKQKINYYKNLKRISGLNLNLKNEETDKRILKRTYSKYKNFAHFRDEKIYMEPIVKIETSKLTPTPNKNNYRLIISHRSINEFRKPLKSQIILHDKEITTSSHLENQYNSNQSAQSNSNYESNETANITLNKNSNTIKKTQTERRTNKTSQHKSKEIKYITKNRRQSKEGYIDTLRKKLSEYDDLVLVKRDLNGKFAKKKRSVEEEKLLKKRRQLQKLIDYHKNSDTINEKKRKSKKRKKLVIW